MKFIIDFEQNATDKEIQEYVDALKGKVLQTWKNFEKVMVIETDNHPEKTAIVTEIIEDSKPSIKPLNKIQYNRELAMERIAGAPDVTFNTDGKQDWWKNCVMKEPEFEKNTKTISRKGKEIPVYVMDSGIMKDHPDFADTDIEDVYTVTPGDFSDNNGHGTAIASIISGKKCGISNAPIKNVKIFQPGGTYISDILSALDAIAENCPADSWGVVNCSWVIENNQWIEDKMQSLITRGIMIVAAAGNNGKNIEDVTPAAMPDAFTVGSYSEDLVPSDFSNYTGSSAVSFTKGEQNGNGVLDIWAPGEEIYSATLDGKYNYTAGTSMAAAVASSVIAYNLSMFVDQNGDRSIGYNNVNSPNHPLSVMINYGNHDLLDLSNEKYSDTTNRIITIYNRTEKDKFRYDTMTDYIVWPLVPSKTSGIGPRVINPHNTKSVKFINPLPENFGISSCGSLAGEITDDQKPTGNDEYNLITGTVEVETDYGFTEQRNIEIYILNDKYEPSDLPEDHIININLSATCAAVQGACPIGMDTSCNDSCAAILCCYYVQKGSSCVCA